MVRIMHSVVLIELSLILKENSCYGRHQKNEQGN
jgi:hypothetical protein